MNGENVPADAGWMGLGQGVNGWGGDDRICVCCMRVLTIRPLRLLVGLAAFVCCCWIESSHVRIRLHIYSAPDLFAHIFLGGPRHSPFRPISAHLPASLIPFAHLPAPIPIVYALVQFVVGLAQSVQPIQFVAGSTVMFKGKGRFSHLFAFWSIFLTRGRWTSHFDGMAIIGQGDQKTGV